MKKIIAIVVLGFICFSFKSDNPAYLIFNSKGKVVSYKKMIEDFLDADVVFFGEFHNNPISHWLEYEVTKSIYENNSGKIVMGAEMFEADNQMIVDEFLTGKITSKRFEIECKLWDNYSTDYEPLMCFARDSGVHFVATNIPRRYADMVYRKGEKALKDISDEAQRYIAPFPIEFEPDSVLQTKVGIMAMMGKNTVGIAKAQAMKDATMAYFISKNLKKGSIFIHYNGTFHSDGKEGIIKYLNKYKPGLKIKTISTVQQDNISKLDSTCYNLADYIICIPYSMTRTY